MSVDNNHFNRDIQALRQEEPRQDAKAELILELLKERRETKMSVLRKATLPTLVSVAAIAGVFYVAQPKVVAATPDRVAKAIQAIKNYTINSYTIKGNDRKLQSRATVKGDEKHMVFYDANGNQTNEKVVDMMMLHDSPMILHLEGKGDMKNLSKEEIANIKQKIQISVGDQVKLAPVDGGQAVKVIVEKGPDGKEVKKYFVNGKQVDKLPEGIGAKIGAAKGDGHGMVFMGGDQQDLQIKVTKDKDGKEVKRFFVNGKEVDKLPGGHMVGGNQVKVEVTKDKDGKEVKKFFLNGKQVDKLPEGAGKINFGTNITKGDGKGQVMIMNSDVHAKNGEGMTKSMAVVGGKKGEKPLVVQSGQTGANYLIDLLKDSSRWTIERGVTWNGQKLDKFTLKGPISPIELYVDPSTALPKVLRFGTPMQEGTTIEDVYEYNIQP